MKLMPRPARSATTIYLDKRIARKAKARAAASRKTLSDLVNEGLTRVLADYDRIVKVARERRHGKFRDYEAFVEEMRRDGEL